MSKWKQLTVCCHVDDLKISQIDKNLISEVIKLLKMIYGEVHVSQGTKYDYLGMDLDYAEAGKVKISVVSVLKKTINEFPKEINANTATTITTNCSILEMILLESS